MTDMNFPLHAGTDMDDLPRTLRREREAREREARERAPSGLEATSSQAAYDSHASNDQTAYSAADAYPAAVRRLEVPFTHLMGFFLKAVLAAIPALILLTGILWAAGWVLKTFFPELLHMQIMISFPNS